MISLFSVGIGRHSRLHMDKLRHKAHVFCRNRALLLLSLQVVEREAFLLVDGAIFGVRGASRSI